MSAFVKPRLALFVVLAIFIAFKIPHLFYPYYWDESWPYATGVAEMYKHGISLIPGAIDPNVSRGHPMLFHALAALWGRLFGLSHLSMHSFALTISVLFLITIYEAMLRIYNERTAMLALLLVCTQVIFIVQSSYLLLEILVAFLAFLSLYSYIRGRYLLTGLFLSALFYTKESGLIMGFVLGIDALINLRQLNKSTWKLHAARLMSIGVPCILMATFFILQKHINGWYVLPLYTESVEHVWDKFFYGFGHLSVSATFITDYRNWYYYIAGAAIVYAAISKKKFALLLTLIPFYMVYNINSDYYPRGFETSILFLIGFVVAVMLALHLIARLCQQGIQRRFIYLSGCFILCFMLFSASNYFTYRYMLASIIPGLCLAGIAAEKMIELSKPKWIYYVVLTGMMAVSVYAWRHDDGNGDTDVTCYNNMKLQQSIVDYLEQKNAYNESISADGYMNREHLTDPTTGYLSSSKIFNRVKYEIDDSTKYVAVDNMESQGMEDRLKDKPEFHLVYRNAKGEKWVAIYERVK